MKYNFILNKFFNYFFSIQFALILMSFYGLAIGVATFIENDYGTVAAKATVFNTWWLELCLILLVSIFLFNTIMAELELDVANPTWISNCDFGFPTWISNLDFCSDETQALLRPDTGSLCCDAGQALCSYERQAVAVATRDRLPLLRRETGFLCCDERERERGSLKRPYK